MTRRPVLRDWRLALLALAAGCLILVVATFWSAADYNAYEDRFGEGETGPVPFEILLTSVVGTALLVIGAVWLVALLALRPRRG